MQEEWKVINSDDKYQISNYGRVKTPKYPDGYYGNKNSDGYYVVAVGSKNYKVHRIVAKYFIPNPELKPEVNHKDSNKSNNFVSNLEWVTKSENIQHSADIGTHFSTYKFNREQIIEIKTMLKNKIPHHEIAKIYNVTRPCISLIANGKRYANITLND